MLQIKEPDIKILNSSDKNTTKVTNAVDISKDLQKLMLRMKGEFMRDDGKGVEYEKLRKSQLFTDYKSRTHDLQGVNLSELTHEQKVAFFINIYNALTIHGLAEKEKLPKSVLDIQQFWKVTSYKVGGHTFSLDDIEHGVLRGNRPHPSSKTAPFAEDDPRAKLAVKKLDPRVHFALVCGAKSCPAINVYSAESLDAALDAATRSFCSQEVKVYEVQRRVAVSQLFQWYFSDFGANDVEAIRWTMPYLSEAVAKSLRKVLHLLEHEGMVDIEYTKYNWALNDTDS